MRFTRDNIALLAALLVVAVVASLIATLPAAEPSFVSVVSTQEYNASICGGTGYAGAPEGVRFGYRPLLVDNATGEALEGRTSFMTDKTGGSGPYGDSFDCLEQMPSTDISIFAYAPSHAPVAAKLSLEADKLSTVRFSLPASCSGGPSCFDNMRVMYAAQPNEQSVDDQVAASRQTFADQINRTLGLAPGEYTLSCEECLMDRGGFMRAAGKLSDNEPFEFYYHWGWCAPSGGDCGMEICFATLSPKYDEIASRICDTLEAKQYPDYDCSATPVDTTASVRQACRDGAFGTSRSSMRELSLIQVSNQCNTRVEAGSAGCLTL